MFANQSSEASSSSFFENYSSSANIPGLSSTETISFNNEISSSSWEPYSYGELVDNRDGHVYKTIKIGEQTWMAENLNFEYHNIKAFNPAQILPSLCYNSRDSCAKYGRLYSWSTAMDSATIYGKSGQNCGIWSNDQSVLCFNCNSCKAGLLDNLKSDWKKIAVLNIVFLVFLIIVYSVGCCAFRNNRRDNAYFSGWKSNP